MKAAKLGTRTAMAGLLAAAGVSAPVLAGASTVAGPSQPTTPCAGGADVAMGPFNDVGVVHNSTIDISLGCTTARKDSSSPALSAARESAPAEQASAGGDTALNTAKPAAAAAVTYGNVIHGSQTLQDIINIDIAKYRYGHDRIWNGSKTNFKQGQWWMTSSTSVSWNHPSGNPASDGYDGTSVTTAHAYGHGAFHSDFLWCNFQAGQNFYLDTELISYKSGSYGTRFTQSRTCSGTHMATSSKADTNRAAW